MIESSSMDEKYLMHFHLTIFTADIQNTLIQLDCHRPKSNSFFPPTKSSRRLHKKRLSCWNTKHFLDNSIKKIILNVFLILIMCCYTFFSYNLSFFFFPDTERFLCCCGETATLLIVNNVSPIWPLSLLSLLDLLFSPGKFFSAECFLKIHTYLLTVACAGKPVCPALFRFLLQ